MCISILSFPLVMRIWVSCCQLLLRWTIALKLCWKPLLMMLGECGRSLVSTTFLSVKVGRVRITVDMPESVIPEATSQSCIWSRSSLRATAGLLLYQSLDQWEELSSLLTKEAWISGRVLCESPRWVLVDTSAGLHSDDVISRLKEWRVAGLVSQDIS